MPGRKKRGCEGWHTLETIVQDSDSIKDLSRRATAWPSTVIGWGDDEKEAGADAKAKAKEAANAFCEVLQCSNGTCKFDNYKARVTMSERGSVFWVVMLTVTKVKCKCE